jgi:hypothetical protein
LVVAGRKSCSSTLDLDRGYWFRNYFSQRIVINLHSS